MRRVRVVFRAVHYYRALGGVEACPHAHTYTVEVACTECGGVEERLREIKEKLEGKLINDWKNLLYPEPTTESIALSVYALIPEGKVEWVSVSEDNVVKSIYDGREVWVILLKSDGKSTGAIGVKGGMNEMGFAADLRKLYGILRKEIPE